MEQSISAGSMQKQTETETDQLAYGNKNKIKAHDKTDANQKLG